MVPQVVPKRQELEVRAIRIAADSTMLRMVNLLIALSLGVHREQLEQRMGLTWPRPYFSSQFSFLIGLCVRVDRVKSVRVSRYR